MLLGSSSHTGGVEVSFKILGKILRLLLLNLQTAKANFADVIRGPLSLVEGFCQPRDVFSEDTPHPVFSTCTDIGCPVLRISQRYEKFRFEFDIICN
jgi:hypothetical protein